MHLKCNIQNLISNELGIISKNKKCFYLWNFVCNKVEFKNTLINLTYVYFIKLSWNNHTNLNFYPMKLELKQIIYTTKN